MRIVTRASVMTVIGTLLCLAGVLTTVGGIQNRYETAQSAITIREGEPPPDAASRSFVSMDGGDGTTVDVNIDQISDSTRRSLLLMAQLNGWFTTPTATLWVDRSNGSIVSSYNEQPVFGNYLTMDQWRPFPYMIPAFFGALVMLGGVFWMAARWQRAASDRLTEIDEPRS